MLYYILLFCLGDDPHSVVPISSPALLYHSQPPDVPLVGQHVRLMCVFQDRYALFALCVLLLLFVLLQFY